ncbi:MAG: SDR family oxidoreductase [Betaproteobacteria bacterium]
MSASVWNPQAFAGLRLVLAGGCGGIGRHLAGQAAALGAQIRVLDLPASIARHGQSLPPCIAMDAKDPASVDAAMAQAASELGGIDACVNLVGYMSEAKALQQTATEVWQDIMRGNLDAAFFISRAALPHLHRSERASLLHVASGLGAWARPMFGAYGPAKAGMILMVRELALENAPKVRVNAVAPGAVDTAFLRGGTGRSDESAAPTLDPAGYGRVVPLGRIAQPQDVSDPILFLISPAAAYITGQTLQINGGTYMP